MIALDTSFSLTARTDTREKLADASIKFEAIFARQMLASARKAKIDDGGLFSSQANDTFNQMMDERFADILAKSGALGFGKSIETQLASQVAPAADAATKTGEE
jgi:flagellar protein FlgJ